MPDTVATTIKVQPVRKGNGNVTKNSVASVEPDDATLGFSEKQSRISTMVL